MNYIKDILYVLNLLNSIDYAVSLFINKGKYFYSAAGLPAYYFLRRDSE